MISIVNNRFKVIKKRGSGGTGEVFEAMDLRLKRLVAVKRVRTDTPDERREKAIRLLREAETLALVQHPNIVMVHDVIEEPLAVSIIMELVTGIPFRDVYRKGPIAEAEFHPYFRQLLGALEAVHAAGIIHRDVNPQNVLVTPEGVLKLMDFSLATPIRDLEHRAGGTIGYLAPEALRKGARLSFAVDIWGLGLISYQALLGGPAFSKLYGTAKPVDWARWLLSREKFRTLAELGVPIAPGLSALIERMLEKDPKDRHSRLADVRRDAERLTSSPVARAAGGPSLVAGMRRLLPALLARPSAPEEPRPNRD